MTRDAQGPVRLLQAEHDSLLPRVLSELEDGYLDAAPVIRDAGGDPLAYASEGFGDACVLLAGRPADPAGYELTGADPGELVVF